MRRRRVFVVFCILALALGAGYFLRNGATAGRTAPTSNAGISAPAAQSAPKTDAAKSITRKQSPHHTVAAASSTPLPPPGTPLKDVYAELKARADAGDTGAATRLYHDLHRCKTVQEYNRTLSRLGPRLLNTTVQASTPQQLQAQDAILGMVQKEMDFVRDSQATCAGVSNNMLTSLVPQALRAAQLGDLNALNCYMGNDLRNMDGLLDHPGWLTDFKQNAQALTDTALQRGDWVMVELLGQAYGGFFGSSLLTQFTHADPDQYYRYLELQRLGASGDFLAQLDKQVADAGQQLTPDQLSAANTWAQDMYMHYFSGTSSNELSSGVNICQTSDD